MERTCSICQTVTYEDDQTNCNNCGAELPPVDAPEAVEEESLEELDLTGLENGDSPLETSIPGFNDLVDEEPSEEEPVEEEAVEEEPAEEAEPEEEVVDELPVEEEPAEEVVEEPAEDEPVDEGEWDTGAVGAGAGIEEVSDEEEDEVTEETAAGEEPAEDEPAEEPEPDEVEVVDEPPEEDEGEEDREPEDDEMYCPSCNGIMKAESAICPHCSFDTQHIRRCPSCGKGIDTIAEICPHCYNEVAPLEEEVEVVEEGVPDEPAEEEPSEEEPLEEDVEYVEEVEDVYEDAEGEEVVADDVPSEEPSGADPKELKKALKAVQKIEKSLQKDLKKEKINQEEFERMLNDARVEHGLEPLYDIDEDMLPEDVDEKRERRVRRQLEKEEIAEIIEEEKRKSGLFSYYNLSLITLFFFVFLAIFVLVEFILVVTNITTDTNIPRFSFIFTSALDYFGGVPLLVIAVIITMLDAILHMWDKRINLLLSILVSIIIGIGLSMNLLYPTQFIGGDFIALIIVFFLLVMMIIIDLLCVFFKYPRVLEDTERGELQMYFDKEEEMLDIHQKLEEEYQKMIEEEEEKLKMKDEEINEIRTELESLSDQISQEEEKLRMKEEEISTIKAELELKTNEIMEEEEKLRMKEEEMESIIQTELEKRMEDEMIEEEEKLRMKEDELIKATNELEIQKNLMDDTREKLRLKEQEMMSLRTELENQMRHRMEEEDRLKLKEAAAKMHAREKQKRVLFPFTAMVGQDKMKSALILNAIYSEIGGVLIRGQKGTGKSVSVRGLAEILPNIEVTGCRFNCDPKDTDNLCTECNARLDAGKLESFERQVQVVDLPLNVTEDRLVGSIDIEKVLAEGVKSFEPGILADAHRGVLYVDEINLLDDYIVDILLDAASSGVVTIEREGISLSHPSEFIIVGSMNPEEGELRPQILDRIALQTDVIGIKDVEQRINIVRRREEFTADSVAFREKYEAQRKELVDKITRAKALIPKVATQPRTFKLIAQICLDFNVDGHRADIIIERAARANAAFEGRMETNVEDIIAAASMALPHRMRRRAYEEEEEFSEEMLRKLVEKREAELE